MWSLLLFVPTRGRPDSVAELLAAVDETAEGFVRVVFVVDPDDQERELYRRAIREFGRTHQVEVELFVTSGASAGRGMVGALNEAVAGTNLCSAAAVGFLGDDHRPRTRGWDVELQKALKVKGFGLAYGNDLVHGPGLPTAVVMSLRVVVALGFMAPPVLRHLYVDNYWLSLGKHLDAITYLPHVVIEHMHPLVGKAPEDEGYRRVNAAAVVAADAAAFDIYVRTGGVQRDADLVRRCYQSGGA